MRKSLVLLCVLLAAAPFAAASSASPFADFETRVRGELIKPLALDLGGLLGSASAHTGRSLGLPGFWAGAIGAAQFSPDKNDLILRDSGVKAFGLPMLEVGVGLPFKVDVIARGMKIYDASIFGAGLRYGLYRTDLIDTFLPNVSLAAFGDRVNHKSFSATHGGFDAAATWNLPIVKPFFVAGFDVTALKVGAAAAPGVAGMSATARGSRFSVGAELTPFPFVALRGACTLRHGMSGFDAGLGVKF
ncbi:MAG TPA: hypothetical protein DCZ01_13270 [Elusimicrobia bacterium]|nr:MAG: hypothetical protein A2X37_08210 [Elusimicrobia bacterium GWA2_66_18]OGR73205.1 MAG: hypothetical protein A2X40_05695 [Elusimicrobia bacterium GWC2_65_9]HAZ09454.1 hypothetical protein [Elusimicrobiota bacterium]